MNPPDYVAQKIKQAVRSGALTESLVVRLENPAQAYLAHYELNTPVPIPESFYRALRIYQDPYKKEVVEAFIIAGAEDQTFTDILLIPAECIKLYRQVFFNMHVFEDRLDIDRYVKTYPTSTDELAFGYELKTAAIEMGLEYLKVRFSHGTYEVPPVVAVRSAITQSFLLGRAAQRAGIDTNVSREARSWMGAMAKNISILPSITGDDQTKTLDLRIALQGDTSPIQQEVDNGPAIDPSDIVTE